MGMYREDIKRIYSQVGNEYRKMKQSQEQTDMVNSPPHYNKAGIETIQAIKAMLGEGFKYYLQGNIMKYIWRYQYKDGVQDLEKAQWHLNELIKELKENDTS